MLDGYNIDIDFKFNDNVPRRVNGFYIKSANDHPQADPKSVTVSWDLEISKPTKSISFPLDFEGKRWHSIYNDLPDIDVAELTFTLVGPDSPYLGSHWVQLGQIELFGPTAAAIQTGKDEITEGKISTEDWWVFTAATATDAEECVKASRTTTTSGYYVDSSVLDVPKSECCLQGNALDQAQLKLACV